jgi:CBS domain containing-hemolysin-like protein
MPEFLASVGPYLPWLSLLLLLSGFFSCSEAAFFSLTLTQRRGLAKGERGAQAAHRLLSRSERLLMGILFWNLAINVSFFSMVSRVALEVETARPESHWAAVITFTALVIIIIFGEFLPKSIAVLNPLSIVTWVAPPLIWLMRPLDVVLPLINGVNEVSRRLLWPGLKAERYLELTDLERAIELSTDDAQLYEQERHLLRNLIQLSEIRVEEWMRPRTQYRTFTPPVSLAQLGGRRTPSGYMLITDPEGREVVGAINLNLLQPSHTADLAHYQESLVVVPWCATVADALNRLRESNRRVAAVVNEFGESIGILTWEEIFEAILYSHEESSIRELAKAEVRMESEGVWIATGMTKLRRLERLLGRRFTVSHNLTVGGVIQEQLRRLPEKGDVCTLENLRLEIIESGQRGQIRVRISEAPSDLKETE